MSFLGILITIIFAIIISGLFYYVFKSTGPWGTFWTFVVILILAGLAGSFWITPVGPAVYNVAFIPTLFVIFVFALILAAASPPRNRKSNRYNREKPAEDEAGALAIGAFFWILMSILLMIAIWGALI
jgi:hypothetical protein